MLKSKLLPNLPKFGIFIIVVLIFSGITSAFAQTPSASPSVTGTPTATPSVTTTGSITPSITVTDTPTPSATITTSPAPVDTSVPLPVNASVTVEAQYPWNKQIPVTVQLQPRIDGQRLQISWPSRTGVGFIITPRTVSWPNVKAGQTYTMTFTFDPISSGLQKLSADVKLTTLETNYVSSIPLEINLDSQKIVQPVSSGYRNYETAMYVGGAILLFVVIPLAVFLSIMYIKNKLIPRWIQARLNEPI